MAFPQSEMIRKNTPSKNNPKSQFQTGRDMDVSSVNALFGAQPNNAPSDLNTQQKFPNITNMMNPTKPQPLFPGSSGIDFNPPWDNNSNPPASAAAAGDYYFEFYSYYCLGFRYTQYSTGLPLVLICTALCTEVHLLL